VRETVQFVAMDYRGLFLDAHDTGGLTVEPESNNMVKLRN
jgi:hypothetical protein